MGLPVRRSDGWDQTERDGRRGMAVRMYQKLVAFTADVGGTRPGGEEVTAYTAGQREVVAQ